MGVFLGNLVIPINTKPSSVISGRILRTVGSVEIHAPAALTGTITVQSANDLDDTTFNNIQSPPGTDVVITAGDTTTLTRVPAHGIRVNSGSDEGAERTFPVFGEEKAHQ